MGREERWIVRDDAIARLHDVFALSRGAAENKLREICRSGDVRMYCADPVLLLADDGLMNFNLRQTQAAREQLKPGPELRSLPPYGKFVHGSELKLPVPADLLVSGSDFDWWLDQNSAKATPTDEVPPPNPRGFHTSREAALKAKCVSWIRQQPVQPVRKREDLKVEAQKEIQGLSGRQFTAAWDEAAPAEWKQAGRRPGK